MTVPTRVRVYAAGERAMPRSMTTGLPSSRTRTLPVLDVPVEDAGPVHVVECGSHPLEDDHQLPERGPSLELPDVERVALDELGDEVEVARAVRPASAADDVEDVGVAETQEDRRFSSRAGLEVLPLHGVHGLGEPLALELQGECLRAALDPVDFPHSPAAEPAP